MSPCPWFEKGLSMLPPAYCHHTRHWGQLVLLVGSRVLQEKGQAMNRELQVWEPHHDSLEKRVCCQVAFQIHRAADGFSNRQRTPSMGQETPLRKWHYCQFYFQLLTFHFLSHQLPERRRRAAARSPGNRTTKCGTLLSHEMSSPLSTGMAYHANSIFVSAFYFSLVVKNDGSYPVCCA